MHRYLRISAAALALGSACVAHAETVNFHSASLYGRASPGASDYAVSDPVEYPHQTAPAPVSQTPAAPATAGGAATSTSRPGSAQTLAHHCQTYHLAQGGGYWMSDEPCPRR